MHSLLETLLIIQTWVETAAKELEANPSLADNPRWREHLAQTGYQIETLLGDEDDDTE